jgi:DNA polymerase-3 subunit epsilon
MKNLLIVDLETTGLNPEIDQPIELGAILYSVEHHCTLQQVSTVLPVLENAAESINRISAVACQALSEELIQQGYELFYGMLAAADYVVAHNAAFDSQWLNRFERFSNLYQKPWLCTYDDFIWPENTKPTSLVTTALNHGIGVSHAHRALTDCQLIAALFDRVEYHQPGKLQALVTQAIHRASEPQFYVIAHVDIDDRQLAKKRGFRWCQYLDRKWVKKMRCSDYEAEKSEYPFQTTIQSIDPV